MTTIYRDEQGNEIRRHTGTKPARRPEPKPKNKPADKAASTPAAAPASARKEK